MDEVSLRVRGSALAHWNWKEDIYTGAQSPTAQANLTSHEPHLRSDSIIETHRRDGSTTGLRFTE